LGREILLHPGIKNMGAMKEYLPNKNRHESGNVSIQRVCLQFGGEYLLEEVGGGGVLEVEQGAKRRRTALNRKKGSAWSATS